MTTFEFLVLLEIGIVILLLIGGVWFLLKALQRVVSWQYAIWKELHNQKISDLKGVLDDIAVNCKGHYNELQMLKEELNSRKSNGQ